ncbi:MAG: amidase [Rubrobacteraceae bacterium]
MNESGFPDATAQAGLIRSGEATAEELLESAIAKVEELNPTLNAVVETMYEPARSVARDTLSGPFAGVPFLLKDLGASYAGVPTTSGSGYARDFVPEHDSELTARYKRAGLVIFGKTNTPEFGIQPTTEPRLFGPCRNPWDPERSTGGSSGGAAAAVSSGIVAMAHASDGGGSIRIPASCCGLFGLKPTRARTTLGPDVGDTMGGLVAEHAVTRSVRDSAALLDAVSGPMPGDPYVAPPPERPFVEEVGADPGILRVAFSTGTATGVPVHPDCVAAVQGAARLCAELGHEVEEAAPVLDGKEIERAFSVLWSAGVASGIEGLSRVMGKEPDQAQFEPLTWALYEMGRNFTAPDYLLATSALQRVSRVVAAFFENYDVWLTPTLAEPPPPLGTFDSPPEDPLRGYFRAADYVPFTPIFNVTGQPAMSVPLYWNEAGLPIGAHFAGRFGDEATLFRLAARLEEARPWAGRRPPVAG